MKGRGARVWVCVVLGLCAARPGVGADDWLVLPRDTVYEDTCFYNTRGPCAERFSDVVLLHSPEGATVDSIVVVIDTTQMSRWGVGFVRGRVGEYALDRPQDWPREPENLINYWFDDRNPQEYGKSVGNPKLEIPAGKSLPLGAFWVDRGIWMPVSKARRRADQWPGEGDTVEARFVFFTGAARSSIQTDTLTLVGVWLEGPVGAMPNPKSARICVYRVRPPSHGPVQWNVRGQTMPGYPSIRRTAGLLVYKEDPTVTIKGDPYVFRK